MTSDIPVGAPSEPPVRTEFTDGVATVTLNNPRRKNAISLEMAALIDDFCARVETDTDIGAVVVRAAGAYFCSGADTRDLAASSADPASPEAVRRTSAVYGSFVRVGSLPVPTISRVVGGAVGAGLNLALATDLMAVTPQARLDSGFLARGIHPGGGHLALLGRSVGWSGTIALAACGQSLTGTEAVQRGLAHLVAEEADLDARIAELTGPPAADPELTRRIMASARLELGPPAVSWASALEIERGVQMWSMSRKGEASWSSRGPGR
ncbi:enoyl-CoA hydratase-related protein [Nocardia nova]|uniref:enoyl-CoA hydratase-related protein n=1 Tax=Nocardia nova TaxID=37330 RepID=UPI00371870DE